ncbi:MAG: succinyldiaminopimelate transaminase [Pseudomonadales bacterium]
MTNPALARLHAYPFERLAQMKGTLTAPADKPHIALSLGEPKHPAPDFVVKALSEPSALRASLGAYPTTRGSDALREAMAQWLSRRYGIRVDPARQVLPVAGTREALFSVAQALLSRRSSAIVGLPNPFYQIYEGAALMGNAQPLYLPCTGERNYQPDWERISPSTWRNLELLYLCSPGNPTGAVASETDLRKLLALAHEYDFVIASDECYSEIYPDEAQPPVGLLQAAAAAGDPEFHRCLVFNSLSKRSNLPGLRSGLVAGNAELLAQYLKYRTYQGCALPAHTQAVSALAWADEAHVAANRLAYREKFNAVLPVLAPRFSVNSPEGGFFYWLPVPGDDVSFASALFESEHITVLPGSFLGRGDPNPGSGHVRIAWVAPLTECREAAARLARFADHSCQQ